MAEVRAEHTKSLEYVDMILKSWYARCGGDILRVSHSVQEGELSWPNYYLETLVKDLKPDYRVQLQVGDEPADGSYFSPNAYQFLEHRARNLEPGTMLSFERTDYYHSIHGKELYAGQALLIAVSALAKTLNEGSRLAIIETPAQSADGYSQ